MTVILPIIYNYNQPATADLWYKKLTKDRFKQVVLSDNGSDPDKVSQYTNFSVKKNIYFGGITNKTLAYCLENHTFDYVWICNTSASPLEEIDYYTQFQECLSIIGANYVGTMSPSFIANKTANLRPFHNFNTKKKPPYTAVDFIEGISIVIKRELLEHANKNNLSYFRKELTRGWGQDYEICLTSLQKNYLNIILSNTPINFKRNYGYKENLRSESLKSYSNLAQKEMTEYLDSHYINIGLYLKYIYASKLNKIKTKVNKSNCYITPPHHNIPKLTFNDHDIYTQIEQFFIAFPPKPSSVKNKLFCANIFSGNLSIRSIDDLLKLRDILYERMYTFKEHSVFIQMIAYIFFKKCFDCSPLGNDVYNIFNKSQFRNITPLSFLKRVEFFIRCKLKIT